ncbi:MAG: hypothetical protein E5W83_22835, partial [Mesorhizobium sp.]
MRKLPLTRICWLALRASTVLALAVAPYHVTFNSAGAAKIGAASAQAQEDGGSGGSAGGGDTGGSTGGGGDDGAGGAGGEDGAGGGTGGDDGA